MVPMRGRYRRPLLSTPSNILIMMVYNVSDANLPMQHVLRWLSEEEKMTGDDDHLLRQGTHRRAKR